MCIDFGYLTETKINHEMYMKQCCGYQILCTKAASHHLGGLALFWHDQNKYWSIEGVCTFGPNVIHCSLVLGNRCWTLVGAYIPPSEEDSFTTLAIKQAVQLTHSAPIIFFGDINVDLLHVVKERDEYITSELQLLGLMDVANGF